MSASPGKGGGSRALINLRSVIEAAGGEVIESQLSTPNADRYFSEKAKPENPALRKEIENLLEMKSIASENAEGKSRSSMMRFNF